MMNTVFEENPSASGNDSDDEYVLSPKDFGSLIVKREKSSSRDDPLYEDKRMKSDLER